MKVRQPVFKDFSNPLNAIEIRKKFFICPGCGEALDGGQEVLPYTINEGDIFICKKCNNRSIVRYPKMILYKEGI